MRRLTVMLTATALALTGALACASPAMAGGDLVDIKVGDIVLYNDIDTTTAAALCGILDVNALIADLNDGDNQAACPALSPAMVYNN